VKGLEPHRYTVSFKTNVETLKNINNLRLRLLSIPKREISTPGQHSKHAPGGACRKRSLEGIPCLVWSVSNHALCVRRDEDAGKEIMRTIGNSIGSLAIIGGLIASLNFVRGQTTAKAVQSVSAEDMAVMLQAVEATTPLPAESAPKSGTFYSAQCPNWPPLPGNVNNAPAWNLGDGVFLLDDLTTDYSVPALSQAGRGMRAMDSLSPPGFGVGDGCGSENLTTNTVPSVSTYVKFIGQFFSVIDTNKAAIYNTNLYKTLLSFATDTNTSPVLQILPFQTNSLIIKASHFNYSAETVRDFALVINDMVDAPLYKTIDLSNTNNQNGWLIQGLVSRHNVTDPMYLMISNISRSYNGFFRAVPYDGPQIQLTGKSAYATVSNIITLTATITDLSGVTNEQLDVTVDGLPARYSLGPSNTINLDTRYNYTGPVNVYVSALNNAQIYDPTNPPDKARLFYSGAATLPLFFTNDTYLAFASDYCPTNVGVNYIYFTISKAQEIEASITDPADDHLVAYFYGYVPYPATVAIPWDFTDADGVTPYTNDTYVVTFTAFDPATLTITNKIDRGVRAGAGCFLTYQWEDPADPTGDYLNTQADIWIGQTLKSLYTDMYQWWSITWYDGGTVGSNRNHSDCKPYNSWSLGWEYIMPSMSNSALYSDLTIAQAHGSGATIGGGDFLTDKFTPMDLQRWIMGSSSAVGPNWRLRKAALWTCYSGAISPGATGSGRYSSFPDACGIRPTGLQNYSYMRKNCGLFFGGLLPQGGFGGTSATTAQVAEFLDQAWVCGENEYPGGCDPTYSFAWAVNATRNQYNPQLDSADPRLFGLRQMIYSSVYDDELMMLNFSHVKYPY